MPQYPDEAIIITRKNIKHLYLRIDRQGVLQVSAPKRMSEAQILAFIAEKRDWIAQKQHLRQNNPSNNLDSFQLFGQQYPIERKTAKHNTIRLERGICYVSLKDNTPSMEDKLIIEYYRAQLRPLLNKWVTHYSPIIGVKPSEVRTKNMKTKWGTCNTHAKRLWFNVQLARFSEKHVEYVVVHEMVHLLERGHNARFYALVAQAMPDWKTYHDALKHQH